MLTLAAIRSSKNNWGHGRPYGAQPGRGIRTGGRASGTGDAKLWRPGSRYFRRQDRRQNVVENAPKRTGLRLDYLMLILP
jgi:hypothetical protein